MYFGGDRKVVISNLKRIEDLEILAECYATYYQNSVLEEKWSKETVVRLFHYFYDQTPDLFFVADDEDKPVGVIMTLLKPWWDGMHLEDTELFVCLEYRRQGIAKMLFKKLFEYASSQYNVTVLEAHTYEDENGFPYCWYKRIGFETIDDWKIISGDIETIMNQL